MALWRAMGTANFAFWWFSSCSFFLNLTVEKLKAMDTSGYNIPFLDFPRRL